MLINILQAMSGKLGWLLLKLQAAKSGFRGGQHKDLYTSYWTSTNGRQVYESTHGLPVWKRPRLESVPQGTACAVAILAGKLTVPLSDLSYSWNQ